ncbi:MAG: hypothetical protein HDS71_07520 [Bacteroidales bacterium]|nr:hypothetical protein [Bacteroidales bacterium]
MKETKTPTPPAWVQEMQKWQSENKEQRAVFCVTSDEESLEGVIYGSGVPILAALLELAEIDNDYKKLILAAQQAIDNPIGKMLVRAKWEEYKKEHGIKNFDEEEAPGDSSMKEFLKTILTKLADKL